MEPSEAKQLQAALRAYEAARMRLGSATEESYMVKAAEDYVAAKAAFKEALEAVDE
jgi:hypothetical protein